MIADGKQNEYDKNEATIKLAVNRDYNLRTIAWTCMFSQSSALLNPIGVHMYVITFDARIKLNWALDKAAAELWLFRHA